jgi:acyl carrier protein
MTNISDDRAIAAQVIALIARRKALPPESITREMTLAEAGVNSLDAIELVFDFEDAFNISIPNEAVQRLRTVDDVVRALGDAPAKR